MYFKTNRISVLLQEGIAYFLETIQKIKEKGIKTALWSIDAPSHFQPIISAAPFYDFLFCGGTEAQELLKEAGIKETFWLPFACDPEFHKPFDVDAEEQEKWGSQVTFVGSYYPNRHAILEKLSDLDLKIWGPGWNKLPADSPLRPLAEDVQLSPEEWRKIYSSSKIVVVIHFKNETYPLLSSQSQGLRNVSLQKFSLG